MLKHTSWRTEAWVAIVGSDLINRNHQEVDRYRDRRVSHKVHHGASQTSYWYSLMKGQVQLVRIIPILLEELMSTKNVCLHTSTCESIPQHLTE